MEIAENIFRIVIPFEDIYTTVFLIRTENGAMLFDTATFDSDMDEYVFPFLEKMGLPLEMVFVSHNHRDHAGGLARLVKKYPNVRIASRSEAVAEQFGNVFAPSDGEILLECLRVVEIPGHTQDCMGVLDQRTGTLLTGDSLQLYGIYGSGKWGANIRFPREHFAALEKLQELEIEMIVASHDYHPCGYAARGKPEAERYVNECRAALNGVREMIAAHPELDDDRIAEKYNTETGLPVIGAHVVEAVRRDMM